MPVGQAAASSPLRSRRAVVDKNNSPIHFYAGFGRASIQRNTSSIASTGASM